MSHNIEIGPQRAPFYGYATHELLGHHHIGQEKPPDGDPVHCIKMCFHAHLAGIVMRADDEKKASAGSDMKDTAIIWGSGK